MVVKETEKKDVKVKEKAKTTKATEAVPDASKKSTPQKPESKKKRAKTEVVNQITG